MEFSREVYIFELYSGNGHVAPLMSKLLGSCPYETVDMEEKYSPTIVKDILTWTEEDSANLRAKHLGRRPIIFASPPCEHYSQARTTGGPRNLERSDAMVAKIKEIADALDALFIFVENPESGLLKSREVIQFMPHSYGVDYCAYGMLYQKPTLIWTSEALDEARFVRKRCGGPGACASMIHKLEGKWEHVMNVQQATYDKKISIPDQLVVALINGALPVIRRKGVVQGRRSSMATTSQEERVYEVDYIQDAKIEDGELKLLISWVGWDKATWEPADSLTAPFNSYGFISREIMAKATSLRADSMASRT